MHYSIMFKSYNIKLCLKHAMMPSSVSFSKYIIAVKEIKMLKLETLFMLGNAVFGRDHTIKFFVQFSCINVF